MQAERRNPLARRQDEEIVLASQGNGQKEIEIKLIRRDGGTQPRDGINQLHVADMRIALQQDKPLPAVEVIYDGESYWLWDGFHRIEAHIAEERTTIAANVRQGTLQDAQWESYSVNAGHGLKRSNADKERQVRNALRHPKAQGMSNVQIAKHVGVDDKTVRRYRAEMEAASEIPSLTSRQGADGKTYPALAPRLPRAPTPTRYPIPDELAAAGYVVEDHPAGGYGAVLIHSHGKVHLPKAVSLEQAITQIEKHMVPAMPRQLNLDETIAVIWRLIKHNCAGDQRAETLHGIVTKHSRMTDYEHLLTAEVAFHFGTFAKAWSTVANELLGRIEHAERAAQKAQAHQALGIAKAIQADADTILSTELAPAPPQRKPQFTAAMTLDGWELRQVSDWGSPKWRAHNTVTGRFTAAHVDPNDAISAAYEKQFEPEPTVPDLPALIAIYDAAWQNIPACSELLNGQVSHTIRLQLGSLLAKLRSLESEA